METSCIVPNFSEKLSENVDLSLERPPGCSEDSNRSPVSTFVPEWVALFNVVTFRTFGPHSGARGDRWPIINQLRQNRFGGHLAMVMHLAHDGAAIRACFQLTPPESLYFSAVKRPVFSCLSPCVQSQRLPHDAEAASFAHLAMEDLMKLSSSGFSLFFERPNHRARSSLKRRGRAALQACSFQLFDGDAGEWNACPSRPR